MGSLSTLKSSICAFYLIKMPPRWRMEDAIHCFFKLNICLAKPFTLSMSISPIR